MTQLSVKPRKEPLLVRMKRFSAFYLFLLIPLAQVIIFNYMPMYGIQIAFKDYKMRRGINGSSWAGLEHFQKMFSDTTFYQVLGNTLRLSLESTLIIFPATVIFALMMNEMCIRDRLRSVCSPLQPFGPSTASGRDGNAFLPQTQAFALQKMPEMTYTPSFLMKAPFFPYFVNALVSLCCLLRSSVSPGVFDSLPLRRVPRRLFLVRIRGAERLAVFFYFWLAFDLTIKLIFC